MRRALVPRVPRFNPPERRRLCIGLPQRTSIAALHSNVSTTISHQPARSAARFVPLAKSRQGVGSQSRFAPGRARRGRAYWRRTALRAQRQKTRRTRAGGSDLSYRFVPFVVARPSEVNEPLS